LPGETKKTIQNTINFALKSGIKRANFGILSFVPGSAYWSEYKGVYKTKLLNSMMNAEEWLPEGFVSGELLKAKQIAFFKFYLRPKAILYLLSYIKPQQISLLMQRFLIVKSGGRN
jgi:radical SAM superfamily enzyme YgiQ (UPF0313 family)